MGESKPTLRFYSSAPMGYRILILVLILVLMDLNDNYSQDFTSPNFSVPWGHGMRWQVKHQPGIAGPRRSHKGPAETSFVVRRGRFFWMSHDVSIQTGTQWGTECRIIIDTGRLDDIWILLGFVCWMFDLIMLDMLVSCPIFDSLRKL